MTKCPACGIDTEGSGRECPVCGETLEGTTQSFAPVTDEMLTGVPAAVEKDEGPALIVRKGPELGERFYLDRARITIGRDPGSDIFLNDVTVSRRHAVVELADGIACISDAGSLNGTYVNGICVDKAQLSNGDVVQVGMFQMLFAGGQG